MSEEITNSEDIIDSRDILERIEYIDELLMGDNLVTGEDDLEIESLTNELEDLKDLAEQCEYCGDWKYGETLIRESYFQEYAERLAEDLGMVDRKAPWPQCHIDWEAAAESLKQDYIPVDFDGEEYWIRM
jgi:hypothetical protein